MRKNSLGALNNLLLDADAAVNSANWMWLSATCFFYTYHRVYSPAHFARRYDRSGRYVRHWLPALRRLPDASGCSAECNDPRRRGGIITITMTQ